MRTNCFLFVFDQTAALVVCVISYITTYHINSILGMEVWSLALLSVSLLIFSSCIFMICRQPQTSKKVSFMVRGQNINIPGLDQSSADTLIVKLLSLLQSQVPLLPFLPILSVFVNIYLMIQLSGDTWIRFSVWMAVGEYHAHTGSS